MADPVVIVGGGLAGTAAALRLADAGRQVVLLESRPTLGGRATSFRRGGLAVDNGQHVFLRCCTAYRALLDRLGVAQRVTVQRRLSIPVLGTGRGARIFRSAGMPAPFQLGAALASYRWLPPVDRLRAAACALSLRRVDPDDDAVDARSFGDYLREHGQSREAVDRLWSVIVTATLNSRPDEASLALAAKVFRTGLLEHADAADVGYALAPLQELHGTAARAALESAGVEVLTSHRVEAVEPLRVGAMVRARTRRAASVRTWHTDSVVLAVPPRVAFAVSPALHRSAAAPAARLDTSPIVNVHVVYDRPVTELAFAAAIDSPVQWFFDRTAASGAAQLHPRGQYLAVTMSAADAEIGLPTRLLATRIADELGRLLPAARTAGVLDAWVTREPQATFRQAPGTAALRPRPDDGPPGMLLAGAWTATGWPDTMESAVRSGDAAAAAVLGMPKPTEEAAA